MTHPSTGPRSAPLGTRPRGAGLLAGARLPLAILLVAGAGAVTLERINPLDLSEGSRAAPT